MKLLGYTWKAEPAATILSMLQYQQGKLRKKGRHRPTWLKEVKEESRDSRALTGEKYPKIGEIEKHKQEITIVDKWRLNLESF